MAENEESKVKVAVFGHGFLGKWHAQKASVLESSELTLIVEPNPEQHDSIRQSYPNAEVVETFHGHEEKFEAAVLATPTSTHYQLCRELLKASKHVFCEKPVTSTYAEASELKELIAEHLVFQVGHSERCHAVWERENLWRPFTQEAASFEFSRIAPFKGRATDVDVVQDLMIHDIDLMLWLSGENPISVAAKGFKIRTDKWDHVEADFSFASGKKARITVGRSHVVEERQARFINEFGVAELDLMSEQIRSCARDAAPGPEGVDLIQLEKRDHLLIEQEYFYQSILEHSPPFVGIDDGANAVYLVEKTLQSLAQAQSIEL
jgi:predicted dehydrogenase